MSRNRGLWSLVMGMTVGCGTEGGGGPGAASGGGSVVEDPSTGGVPTGEGTWAFTPSEDTADPGCKDPSPFYQDLDLDGWGNDLIVVAYCSGDPLPPWPYAFQGGDCNDEESRAFPGLGEIACDEVDNDCDGVEAPCGYASLADADRRIVGEAGSGFGTTVVTVGDVDGGGSADVLVGYSWEGSTIHSGDYALVSGEADGSWLGGGEMAAPAVLELGNTGAITIRGVGDVDRDGVADLLFHPFYELWAGGPTLRPLEIRGDLEGQITEGGEMRDVDGDGAVDLAYKYGTVGHVLSGLTAESAGEELFWSTGAGYCSSDLDRVEMVPDMDSDGVADVLVARFLGCDGLGGTPWGELMSGTSRGEYEWIDGDVMAKLSSGNWVEDADFTGDVNGDGYPDAVVSLAENGVHVTFGPLVGLFDTEAGSDMSLVQGRIHQAVVLGDVDQDGMDDVGGTGGGDPSPGWAFSLHGQVGGGWVEPDLLVLTDGFNAPEEAAAVDLDRDGLSELVVGDARGDVAYVLNGIEL